MATENVQITLKINADGATATLKNFEGKIISSTVPVNKLKEALGGIPVAARKAGASMDVSKKKFDAFAKSVGGFTTKTGAASASALELGRIVSDMPYGIRGVANNMSQFASMMAMSARSTDAATGKAIGLSGAIKGLWSSLMGPLGVLLAIQAVIAAWDYFSGGAKKAAEATNNYKDSVKDLSAALKDLYLDQDGVNAKIKDYAKYIDLKNKLDEKIEENSKKLIKTGKDLEISRAKEIATKRNIADLEAVIQTEKNKGDKARTDKIEQWEKRIIKVREIGADASKETTRIEKERHDQLTEGIKLTIDLSKAKDALNDAEEGSVTAMKAQVSAWKVERDAVKRTKKEYADFTKKIDNLQEVIDKITGKKKKKEKEKFILKDPKDFDKELKTLEGMAIKYYQKSLVKQSENGLDKLKAEKSNEEDRLEALKVANEKRFDEQAEAAKKEYNTYLKLQVAKGNITEIERQKKQVVFDDSIDLDVAKQKKAAKETYDRAVKALNFLYDGLFEAEKKKQEDKKKRGDLAIYKDRLDAMRAYAAEAKKILSSVTGFIDGEFDRELAIEKNKTNAINNELNQRLLNENLSKTQRQNIQNQIAQNDEALRKKQEAIERKKFEMNKAANIAGAVIDTYRAAAGVLKDTSGGPFARIAGMVAVIGAGLAQVTAISRQKFVSSAGAKNPILSGGASGSSGGADRSFNFNLVGNTQANQIADAIQGRFNQPLKAFVVSRDITTQQELDANIKGSASF